MVCILYVLCHEILMAACTFYFIDRETEAQKLRIPSCLVKILPGPLAVNSVGNETGERGFIF